MMQRTVRCDFLSYLLLVLEALGMIPFVNLAYPESNAERYGQGLPG